MMYYIKYYWILYIYCTSACIFSLFLFVHKQYEDAREWVFHSDDGNKLEEEVDFIVVGGGSAGSVVAKRLAESKEASVLLIEAGGAPSAVHNIPMVAPLLQRSPYDWQYVTEPQASACLAMKDRKSVWPLGKMLGGTSRLNYMIYLRGHVEDYEDWSNGNDWSASDVMHYFKKSENQLGIYRYDKEAHGTNGPVFIDDLIFRSKLADSLVDAAIELGYPYIDLNKMNSTPGIMLNQVTSYQGSRWSSDRVLNHQGNLRILVNTLVTKILFKDGFEAYGVYYKRFGRLNKVLAKKAVILSAGTVGSAKLLLLSGVGPKEELRNLGINPIVNLPVGGNLQDHVTTGLDLIVLNESLPFSEKVILNAPFHAYEYFFNYKGILTHPGPECVGLFHLTGQKKPDIQFMAMPAGASTDAGTILRKILGLSDEAWNDYFAPLVGTQVATVIPTLLHPKSRGFVKLRSKNPADLPLIDPKYLDHPDDIKNFVLGIKLLKRFLSTDAMRKLGARLNDRKMPGCSQLDFDSDAYWECYLRHLTLTAYHPVGTCKMGANPETSVVSYDLRPHNTNKLFVIDASIMPSMPSGNTLAAVLMIAEKGVELIRRYLYFSEGKCHYSDIFLHRARVNS